MDHHESEYVIGAAWWVRATKSAKKYMPLYVAEFQFRYNNRKNPDIFGTMIPGC